MKLIKIAIPFFGEKLPEGDYHNYEADWDYDLDTNPDQQTVQIFEKASNDITKNHMPEFLGVFTGFTLEWIKDSDEQYALAYYVDGTSSEPVIVVNLKACIKIQQDIRDDFTLYQIAKTTIMHELRHAMQDAEGRNAEMTPEEMEDDAETFGMRFM